MKKKITRKLDSILTRNKIIQFIGYPKFFLLIGLLVGQGAPIGFYIHTHWVVPETNEISASVFFYIWMGTTFFFSLFAYTLGVVIQNADQKRLQIEKLYSASQSVEKERRKVAQEIVEGFSLPLTDSIEFLESFKDGLIEPVSATLKAKVEPYLKELKLLQGKISHLVDPNLKLASQMLSSKEEQYSLIDIWKKVFNRYSSRELLMFHLWDAEENSKNENDPNSQSIPMHREMIEKALEILVGEFETFCESKIHFKCAFMNSDDLSSSGVRISSIFQGQEFQVLLFDGKFNWRGDSYPMSFDLVKQIAHWHDGFFHIHEEDSGKSVIVFALPRKHYHKSSTPAHSREVA